MDYTGGTNSHLGREVVREINPAHKVFWVDLVFCVGFAAAGTWQIWDYAMFKARTGNKGYLFSGAHNLWRIGVTCILALVLFLAELISPGDSWLHYLTGFALLFDAGILYIHTEKQPMPLIFPLLEAILTICLSFGVSEKGRMTGPMLLLVASFRLAAEFWPLKQDEDAFKIVSAVITMTLAWHWFPVLEAIDVWNAEQAVKHDTDISFDNTIDFLFCVCLFLGHITILIILWKILPNFFSDDLPYERNDPAVPQKENEIPSW